MRSKDVCKMLNITSQTLWRWRKLDPPPIRWVKLSGSRFEYDEDDVYSLMGKSRRGDLMNVVYARVSPGPGGRGRKASVDVAELDSQVLRVTDFMNGRGVTCDSVYKDVGGSGFDRGSRRGFHRMVRSVMSGRVASIWVESRDRISIFGGVLFEELLRYYRVRLVYMRGGLVNERYRDEVLRDVRSSAAAVLSSYEVGDGADGLLD